MPLSYAHDDVFEADVRGTRTVVYARKPKIKEIKEESGAASGVREK